MAPVVLDTTIADLFRQNGVDDAFVVTMHCVFGHVDLHPEWPAETVYLEDEEPTPYGASEAERARLRQAIMGLKVVKRSFVAGDMKVLLLQPSAIAENIDRVFMQLPEQQRPEPLYVDLDKGNVYDQLLKGTEDHKLLYYQPQGWMDSHDCFVDPTLVFEINSKKFLITSGIQTPKSTMLNLEDKDAKQILNQQPLPFVVKLPVARCGFGTYVVTTEDRRKTMLKGMNGYTARGGGEILLSDYVEPVHNLCVHLFVGPPESASSKYTPTILGVTAQTMTESEDWIGGSIDYAAQADFNRMLESVVRDTTSRLPDAYIGWCGLDIMIDSDGEQWVVDLNARFTGSMPLCVLSNHFSKQLGLDHAEMVTFQYQGDIEMAYDVLKPELDDGSIVVNAVVQIDDETTAIDLIWGAHSQDDLQQKAAYIRKRLNIV